ncbi:hypothetical protein KIH31_03660 [Paenarthrobacter sp. DKR-5]|uniref:hypothetical protein n=1 Tax=Paenarthrobacter sp. DKR-5 TaxID=2835535 RepID=UPI001BDC3F68|nr:hypothetical protein [Paenarthrobacter sp. DKR-5]MBT1001689.1 hypothetical protein [Paenarthrobacter sp. DKR-5]
MVFLKKLPALAAVGALIAGSLVGSAGPAAAAAQVFDPCVRLSSGQVKYSGYGAKRVTFATTTDRTQYRALVTSCVRSGAGYMQEWQVSGTVGKSGFKAPGVPSGPTMYLFSPTGSYSVTDAFGLGNPGTALRYQTLNPGSRWGGHPWTSTYNKYFESPLPLREWPDENMWAIAVGVGRDYQQGVVVNYNRPPDHAIVQDAGFAIFLHSNPVPTAGCIAIPADMVVRYLRSAVPGDRIIMGAVDDVFTPYSSKVFGAITSRYAALGGQVGWLGQPASNEYSGLRNGGAYQHFQRGTIAWSAPTGARTAGGAIRSAWFGSGFINGPFGYPVTDEVRGLRGGGAYQSYQGGVLIWSPATGARESKGAIRAAWGATGFERGFLGYPVSNEYASAGAGRVQDYQGGRIAWSAATGAHVLRGAIGAAYAGAGGPAGVLGYPTGSEATGQRSGGAYQTFEGGRIVWSPATGARILTGAVASKYVSASGINGVLGYPTSGAGSIRDGGVYQNFQGGSIHWSKSTGAHVTSGAVRAAWAATGWENGKLGYPVSDQYAAGTAVVQEFEGGSISVAAGGGVTVAYTPVAPVEPSPPPTGGPTANPSLGPTASPGAGPTDLATVDPTVTPNPTPTATPEPTSAPEPTSTPVPTSTPAAFAVTRTP